MAVSAPVDTVPYDTPSWLESWIPEYLDTWTPGLPGSRLRRLSHRRCSPSQGSYTACQSTPSDWNVAGSPPLGQMVFFNLGMALPSANKRRANSPRPAERLAPSAGRLSRAAAACVGYIDQSPIQLGNRSRLPFAVAALCFVLPHVDPVRHTCLRTTKR